MLFLYLEFKYYMSYIKYDNFFVDICDICNILYWNGEDDF